MKALGYQLAEFGGRTALISRADSRPCVTTHPTTSAPSDAGTRPAVPAHLYTDSAEDSPSPAVSEGLPASAVEQTSRTSEALLTGVGDLLAAAGVAAPEVLAGAGYVEASVFAGKVEDLARSVEYLQLLAAGAVDRTRTEAIIAAAAARSSRSRGWVTGWDNGVETLNETDATWPGPATLDGPRTSGAGVTEGPEAAGAAAASTGAVLTSPADDGCRNTAEFLRLRLRIPLREARRRLALAHHTLPGTSLTGAPLPPAHPHLATALTPTPGPATAPVSAPVVSSYTGTIITAALDRLRHHTTPESLDRIEHDLTTTAATADPDFITRLAQRWTETIDADGTEPTEEALRHTQGAFIRKPRHGLHHLEIFATTDQYEHLITAMNAATNPRTTTPSGSTHTGTATATATGNSTASGTATGPGTGAGTGIDAGTGTGAGGENLWNEVHPDPDLERRTRPQKQLDGIIGAVTAGLTTNTLPAAGGNRPQIIATINYQDLLPHPRPTSPGESTRTGTGPDTGTRTGTTTGTGTYVFTGPVAAATLRKIACDADIIPALLGTHGEILDLGRKTRLFTPAQRLALTARDQGCTFPNCTIPAPWCEAHHITYWSHGGPTTTDNGALLCSAHHHLIHKDQWTITTRNGTPWYTPPQHIDPHQKPQQNHYFKPPPPPRTPEKKGSPEVAKVAATLTAQQRSGTSEAHEARR